MGKYHGIGGFRIGKVGNERYYLRKSSNVVAIAKPYRAINSQWIKQEEFKEYILSLLNVGIPQVYVLDELPEALFPYALLFIQNENSTVIYLDKEGERTRLRIGGGGGFEPTEAQLEAMNSGINADKEAAFEQNIVDTAEIDAKVTTAAGNITLLEEGKLDKRTEGFEVYSHEDGDQGALLVKQATSGVLADASLLTEKAITDELKKKLSLSGGTMTGTITTDVNIALKRQGDDSEIDIYSGTALNKGASLAMHGKDKPYDPGVFKLYATDGINTKELKGKPNGSLTWNGIDLGIVIKGAPTLVVSGTNYSHDWRIGKLVMFSIGFYTTSDIAKDTTVFRLSNSFGSSAEEVYLIVSTISGNNRILQCGGSYGTKVLVAKSVMPSGYWFGSCCWITND